MPSVSVIVPCFNAARFIGEAIDSALRQSCSDLEVIVVDDGSTDDSRTVVRSFGGRVRLEARAHRGASAARNHGTGLAQGEFIQYLDADDLLAPEAIERRIGALQKTGADVAYGDWQKLVQRTDGTFEAGETVARTMESVHPDPQIAAFTDFWSPPVALLYRRRIVETIGGWNEALPVIQDARFLLDAALHGGEFVYVPEVEAFYRVHDGQSLSRSDRHGFLRDCLENALQVERWWRRRGALSDEQREALLKALFHVARGAFETDKYLFGSAWEAAQRIQPGCVPAQPRSLSWLSRVIGYPRAEAAAAARRRLGARLSASRTT